MSRYARASEDSNADVSRLIAETFPNVDAFYAERLAIEQQIKTGGLHEGPRQAMMRESFEFARRSLGENRAGGFDRWSLLFFLVFVAAGAGATYVALNDRRNYGAPGAIALLITTAAGVLATCVAAATEPSRRSRRRLVPMLARALRPLKPTRAELEGILAECPLSGVRAKAILQAMEGSGGPGAPRV